MAFFTRLSNGWEMTKTSFKVLNANKSLIIFPILSGISLGLMLYSFYSVFSSRISPGLQYFALFLFYLIIYFIVAFFNMALMHCAKLYLNGEEVSVFKGLRFSISRLIPIISWAFFAATIGVILKLVQNNVGWLGRMITGIGGFAWSVSTFFVIPVIAYENVGPYEALKRSGNMMKEKWGEAIGANFSIGLVAFAGFILIGIAGMAVSALVNEQAGIWIFVFGGLAMIAIASALNSIFVSAVYNHIGGVGNAHFKQQFLDDIFVER